MTRYNTTTTDLTRVEVLPPQLRRLLKSSFSKRQRRGAATAQNGQNVRKARGCFNTCIGGNSLLEAEPTVWTHALAGGLVLFLPAFELRQFRDSHCNAGVFSLWLKGGWLNRPTRQVANYPATMVVRMAQVPMNTFEKIVGLHRGFLRENHGAITSTQSMPQRKGVNRIKNHE